MVEKKYIFFAIILFFALVAILFYVTTEKRIEDRGLVENEPSSSLSPSPNPSQVPLEKPIQNNAVQVQEDNGVHSTVRYERGLFSPLEITVTNETGCFVEIKNMSDTDVVPRLGPYNPNQEKGFLYPPIVPHESSLIDPRYGEGMQFSFYNKNNSDAQFIAHIDPTCL